MSPWIVFLFVCFFVQFYSFGQQEKKNATYIISEIARATLGQFTSPLSSLPASTHSLVLGLCPAGECVCAPTSELHHPTVGKDGIEVSVLTTTLS